MEAVMIQATDHIELHCPCCGQTHIYHRGEIRKSNGYMATGIRNPHRTDGPASGSFWRNCSEANVKCQNTNTYFHIDCD